MDERELLVVCLLVSGLTLAGMAVLAIVIIRRLAHLDQGKSEAGLAQIAENQHRLVRAIHPLVASTRPLDSVVTRLSFAESFDPDQFATASRESALDCLNIALKSEFGDGVTLTVNSVQLLRSRVAMTFEASKEGQAMIAEGTAVFARDASGRTLPVLKDVQNGKYLEWLKGAPGAKVLSRLGAMSAAVVGAAHIVAGADIAKRLKQIDSKLNLLLAYRRIDQGAALERIYTSAKELGNGRMNRDKCWELWRLRGELRELRCSWRREFQHHLGLIEDPEEAGWWRRTFSWQKTSDKRVQGQITEGQLQLGLIEYSMRLDQTLAVGSGTVTEFEGTLAGELFELEEVVSLLQAKAGFISGKYPELSVEPTVKAMTDLVEQYKRLLPDSPHPSGDQASLPGEESGSNEIPPLPN
ncbi:MAG: hypothetical protein NTV86_04525 [Planctomycetota bacterium]|nr:hypothetical protein [Planctomycetota bacterium]